MADYTATTNMTLEQAITTGSMVSGENLTIDNGAIVTCNQTPSILIGTVNVINGKFLVDGINIVAGNMINFVGEYQHRIVVRGRGEFDVNGAWFNIGTTDGTTSQVIDTGVAGNNYWDSAHCVDVIPMIQVETGRRINYDGESGTAPEVDDFLRKTSNKSVLGRILEVNTTSKYIVVRYFTGSVVNNDDIQVRKVVDNNGPDLQVSWTAKVNHASGDIKEAGIYQEFGNVVVNGISEIANFHGGVGGFVFANIFQSTNITMGGSPTGPGSLGGFVPPSGCNVRVPNVHFSTSNLTNYGLTPPQTYSTAVAGDRYNLYTGYAGTVHYSICNLGSVWFGCGSANIHTSEFVGATVDFGSLSCGTHQTFDHCVVVQDPLALAFQNNFGFNLNNNMIGATITDCMRVNGRARHGIGAQIANDITITGCIVSIPATTAWSGCYGYYFSYCNTVTFKNNIMISGNTSDSDHVLYITNSPNITCENFYISCTQDETPQTRTVDAIYLGATSNNQSYIGIEILGNGVSGVDLFEISNCDGIKIRCVGMIDDKIDFSTTGDRLVRLSASTKNVSVARCWKKAGQYGDCVYTATTNMGISAINCSGEYNSNYQSHGGDDVKFHGVHGGGGGPGSSTGIEDHHAARYGRQINDGFKSDTAGFITCNFVSPSASINNTTIIAGSPAFCHDGDLDMVSGDILEIEMDYFARGHIAFLNASPNFSAVTGSAAWFADEWTNVTVEFQYDIGSGWSGSWLNARTTSNWTGITIDAAIGVKLKYKFTATGTQSDMSMFVIDTTTSIAHQKANFYPIDQVECDVILNGIVVGSRYWIYNSDTSTELAEGTASADPVTETVTVPGGTNLEIRVRKSSAVVKYLPFKTTAVTNTTEINVAIIQTEDGVAA